MMAAARIFQEPDASEHVAARMATAIAERLKQKGECSIKHLREMGFSLDDVARHWPEACRIAEARGRNLRLCQ